MLNTYDNFIGRNIINCIQIYFPSYNQLRTSNCVCLESGNGMSEW